jgi:hypothetical protein
MQQVTQVKRQQGKRTAHTSTGRLRMDKAKCMLCRMMKAS